MNDQSKLAALEHASFGRKTTRALLWASAFVASAPSALAADAAPPPADATAPTPPAAAPAKAAASPAPEGFAKPIPQDLEENAPDSDASPAVPPPDTRPPVLLAAEKLEAHPARPEQPEKHLDDGLMGSHQTHWTLSIGWRQGYVTGGGFDPFSDDNALPQVSLSGGRTIVASGNLSLVGLFLWDWGKLDSTARSAKTSLTVNRLTLGAEGRYHFFRRLYAFGRIAPGALNSYATLADGVTGVTDKANAWMFASDFSAGAAFEIAGEDRGASNRPRAWVGLDAGYGWAASSALHFTPKSSDSPPVRLQPQSFGDLDLRGAFFRLVATGTY